MCYLLLTMSDLCIISNCFIHAAKKFNGLYVCIFFSFFLSYSIGVYVFQKVHNHLVYIFCFEPSSIYSNHIFLIFIFLTDVYNKHKAKNTK